MNGVNGGNTRFVRCVSVYVCVRACSCVCVTQSYKPSGCRRLMCAERATLTVYCNLSIVDVRLRPTTKLSVLSGTAPLRCTYYHTLTRKPVTMLTSLEWSEGMQWSNGTKATRNLDHVANLLCFQPTQPPTLSGTGND